MTAASPWDALLRSAPIRMAPCVDHDEPPAKPGTKLASLLQVLAQRGNCTTLTLSTFTDLESRQVWGLLKAPRAIGQVRFEAGRWSLVQGFAGRDVERAAALLRDLGWRVQPPKVRGNVAQRRHGRRSNTTLRAAVGARVDRGLRPHAEMLEWT